MTYLAPVAPPVPVPSRDPRPRSSPSPRRCSPIWRKVPDRRAASAAEMERAFGGSDADGAWDWKLAYEAGEVALVLFLRKFGRALLARAGSPAALLPILAKVAASCRRIPGARRKWSASSNSRRRCPWGLAAMAAAQITPRDLVLEPSAGTGLLAILARSRAAASR